MLAFYSPEKRKLTEFDVT
ncbi:MAG: hypothetical protein ACR2MD_12560 [Aridibacter sp.]|nr:hypothetical protein [Acidobacteriota bacterium]